MARLSLSEDDGDIEGHALPHVWCISFLLVDIPPMLPFDIVSFKDGISLFSLCDDDILIQPKSVSGCGVDESLDFPLFPLFEVNSIWVSLSHSEESNGADGTPKGNDLSFSTARCFSDPAPNPLTFAGGKVLLSFPGGVFFIGPASFLAVDECIGTLLFLVLSLSVEDSSALTVLDFASFLGGGFLFSAGEDVFFIQPKQSVLGLLEDEHLGFLFLMSLLPGEVRSIRMRLAFPEEEEDIEGALKGLRPPVLISGTFPALVGGVFLHLTGGNVGFWRLDSSEEVSKYLFCAGLEFWRLTVEDGRVFRPRIAFSDDEEDTDWSRI